MDILLTIFVRVILPVFVMIAIGYVAGRFLSFDLKTLSRFGLYVLVPCMVFTAMARTTIAPIEFGQIVLFQLLTLVPLYGISEFAARLLRLDRAATSSFHISILFTNCVNIGFPILLLAYSPAAVERGVIYMIVMQVVLQTLGVYLAARGNANIRDAITRVAQMPGMYAMGLGIAVNALAIQIPAPIFDPLKLVGDSILPFLLVVLGMQLAAVSLHGQWLTASAATIIRLVVAAGVSIAVGNLMGLPEITRRALILENSMPTAIFGVALAQEFDAAPDLITTVIFISTLASMFTLTVLIAIV
ncbi:MAG: AEC family transporter [Anaerolineales bacterium]|nr:AEC family transporter [Anaerolineales bacterium]